MARVRAVRARRDRHASSRPRDRRPRQRGPRAARTPGVRDRALRGSCTVDRPHPGPAADFTTRTSRAPTGRRRSSDAPTASATPPGGRSRLVHLVLDGLRGELRDIESPPPRRAGADRVDPTANGVGATERTDDHGHPVRTRRLQLRQHAPHRQRQRRQHRPGDPRRPRSRPRRRRGRPRLLRVRRRSMPLSPDARRPPAAHAGSPHWLEHHRHRPSAASSTSSVQQLATAAAIAPGRIAAARVRRVGRVADIRLRALDQDRPIDMLFPRRSCRSVLPATSTSPGADRTGSDHSSTPSSCPDPNNHCRLGTARQPQLDASAPTSVATARSGILGGPANNGPNTATPMRAWTHRPTRRPSPDRRRRPRLRRRRRPTRQGHLPRPRTRHVRAPGAEEIGRPLRRRRRGQLRAADMVFVGEPDRDRRPHPPPPRPARPHPPDPPRTSAAPHHTHLRAIELLGTDVLPRSAELDQHDHQPHPPRHRVRSHRRHRSPRRRPTPTPATPSPPTSATPRSSTEPRTPQRGRR